MSTTRPSWDHYFLKIASVVATRSTCERKQVGCVLVREHMILSTGYGGSIRSQPHCTEAGCLIVPPAVGCQRTVHAEQNAITQAALHGVSTKGATAYVTLSPCTTCFKNLVNAGIVRIIYSEEYRIPPDRLLADSCGVLMEHHPVDDD
jgi:dCMP deaminase